MRIFPLLAALCLAVSAWASQASDLYQKGRKAEKKGQIARAYLLYSEAAALEPENHLYWQRSEALRTRAAMEAKLAPAIAAALPAAATDDDADDPLPASPPVTAADLLEARKPLPPTELKARPGRQDLNLRGDAKSLFQSVARAFELDCVFDGDYQAGKVIPFRMEQADYREALHALEAVTSSFLVPVSPRLFLVVKDTLEKRRQEEPSVTIIVPVPEPTTSQDLTNISTAVQQVCGVQKVAWDSQKNIVVMRDAISKVLPARLLFEDLLYPRAQVEIEMQFLEVSRSDMVNYGLTLPTSFPLYSFSDFLHSAPTIASNLAGVLLFGGGESMLGLGIANSGLVASMTHSNSQVLLQAGLRSIDGQPATMHVGQKYPILTAGYFGPASFSGPQAYMPPPSFTFEDLGFGLKATPHVHGTAEVTLDIEAEFKVLSGNASNGIPIIANRSLKSSVTLQMGEWAVVAGLMQAQDARTLSGIAGLSNIPLLGPLTRNNTRDKSSQEVLIMLRPILLTAPPDESLTHVFRMGSEARPLSPI